MGYMGFTGWLWQEIATCIINKLRDRCNDSNASDVYKKRLFAGSEDNASDEVAFNIMGIVGLTEQDVLSIDVVWIA